ncbi:unnamed protein product, partial [marine sediment metagenome]
MPTPKRKRAEDYFDKMVVRRCGQTCYWCKEWKDTIRSLIERNLKRPDRLPVVA